MIGRVKSRTSKRVEHDEWPVSHRYQVHLNKTDLSVAFNGRKERNAPQNTFNAATSNSYIASLTSKDFLCIVVGLFLSAATFFRVLSKSYTLLDAGCYARLFRSAFMTWLAERVCF